MMFWAVALLCFSSVLLGAFAQGDLGSLASKTMFEQMQKHRNYAICPAKGFYTYEAFIAAAMSFGAFLAQTSHETTVRRMVHMRRDTASNRNKATVDYFVPNQQWPCTWQKILWSSNYNYGPAGAAIGANIQVTQTLLQQIQPYLSRLRCGFG
ncbi:hypothetical protein RJ639_008054 [Escallonia herrerae]|uniref:Glycoside hydrolase family 19 catalytic domain-containing protein n=1 Tax=Escallonia herrerae TaxID=1293975 RepID=A0AA88VYX7_9ASTE|nr:hypothetical protein RJ639_008054 [Escallonia herrerae]